MDGSEEATGKVKRESSSEDKKESGADSGTDSDGPVFRRSTKGSKHCRKRMRQRERSTFQIYLHTEPGKPRETGKTPPTQGGVRNQSSPPGDNICKDSREQRGDPQLSSWGTLFPSRTNKASKGENLSQISRE